MTEFASFLFGDSVFCVSVWSRIAGIMNTNIKDLACLAGGVHELGFGTVLLRLSLALALGGLIGLERERKNRAAGFRTYMLICLGATMTTILGQYEFCLVNDVLAGQVIPSDVRMDISRIAAQVVSGIGFLGAGTILVTGRQQVTGLTTAAGLWACACMGIALGAGFYEAVILAFIFIVLSMLILPKIGTLVVEHSKNMDVYVEFRSLSAVNGITSSLKEHNILFFDIDLDMGDKSDSKNPNAIFSIRINEKTTHTQIIQILSGMDDLIVIKEL